MSLFMIAVAVAVTLTMASGYVLFIAMAIFSVLVMPFIAFFAYTEYIRLKNKAILQHEWDDRLQQETVLFMEEPASTAEELGPEIEVATYKRYNRTQEVLEDVG